MSASFKLASSVFPDGTTVKAYPASNWPTPGAPSGEPVGSAAAEATVSKSEVTFTGLTTRGSYWAAAKVGSSFRYVGFTAGADTSEVGQLEAIATAGVTEFGEGSSPPSTLPAGRRWVGKIEGKNVSEWVGTDSGNLQIADLTGTPADETVTLAKLTQSAVKAFGKVWRNRHQVATTIGAAAQTGKKFWVANGQTSLIEAAASLNQPWRVGWVAADEAMELLTTKCKIKAEVTLGAAINANVTLALYKVGYSGEKLVLGEKVTGSDFTLATGALTNQGVKGESGEFEIKEDVDYAIGAEVSGATTVACGVQARLLVHNT